MSSLLTLFRRRGYRYLLGPFRFAVDAAAPLASPYTEAGAVGSLTLIQTDGQFSKSGGTGVYPAQTTPVWGDLGARGTAGLARVAGRSILVDLVKTAGAFYGPGVGFFKNAAVANTDAASSLLYNVNTLETTALQAGLSIALGKSIVAGTAYQLAVILRAAGVLLLIKGGTFSNWTILWVDNAGTDATVYPGLTNWDASGTLDNLRCLDLGPLDARFATDYGLALNHSTFTAANGTALTAITPEAGGAWAAQMGTLEIQSNTAQGLTYSSNEALASSESGAADVVVDATVRFAATVAGTVGLVVRFSDANNFWLIQLGSAAFKIFEKNAGISTQRATVAVTAVADTDYRIVVLVDGSTITAYVNNASKITYASATLNQTATKHGLYLLQSGTSTGRCDEFVVYPRTLSLPGGV